MSRPPVIRDRCPVCGTSLNSGGTRYNRPSLCEHVRWRPQRRVWILQGSKSRAAKRDQPRLPHLDSNKTQGS